MIRTKKKQVISEKTSGFVLLYELFFNLCLPTLILIKGCTWLGLSSKCGVVLAMACPFSYGLLEWIKERRFNWISFLGLISISVKGSIGLFEYSNQWLALNEALLPGILGVTILLLRLTKRPPFLTKILLNEQFCHVEKIMTTLNQLGNLSKLMYKIYLYEWILAFLFFMSALLNFALARYLVVHPAGSTEFNHELGLLTGWSFVIIAVPATVGLLLIVWQFFVHVQRFSQLAWNEILKT